MRNRKNQFMNSLLAVVFVSIIATPGLLLLTGRTNDHILFGEKEKALVTLNLDNLKNRAFQLGLEGWFSQKYPLRDRVVETYNHIEQKKDAADPFWWYRNILSRPLSRPGMSVASAKTPLFPEYQTPRETPTALGGFKGSKTMIIGDNGYIFKPEYMDEIFGFGFVGYYQGNLDAYMIKQVEKLKFIQDRLKEESIEYMVVITANKASLYREYIPEWYIDKFPAMPEDYKRPYERYKELFDQYGVQYLDSEAVFQEVGLTNTFPKAGIHWNKLAAFEVTRAISDKYDELSGQEHKGLKATGVVASPEPSEFGNPDTDVFDIVYSGRDLTGAIRDPFFYYPTVSLAKENQPAISNVVVQGGSFAFDFMYYWEEYKIADTATHLYYDTQLNSVDWNTLLQPSTLFITEINESKVLTLGSDKMEKSDKADNMIDSLYQFLLHKSD